MNELPFIHYDGPLPGSDFRFLHVEKISTRVRKYNWELFPHRHRDLYQLVLIETGAGEVNMDLRQQTFEAPALVLVPALVVHSFRYATRASGQILTISDVYLQELVRFSGEPLLEGMLNQPMVQSLSGDALAPERISAFMRTINEHLGSTARGRSTLLSASMLAILGLLTHYVQQSPVQGPETWRRRQLYDSFRDHLEDHFREHLPIASYAGMMAVTERTLHRACREVAGESPLKIVHRRLVLEAQRLLLYSAMSVSEAAYELGFKDPSHFSRFFVDNVGESPVVFRRARLG